MKMLLWLVLLTSCVSYKPGDCVEVTITTACTGVIHRRLPDDTILVKSIQCPYDEVKRSSLAGGSIAQVGEKSIKRSDTCPGW